MSAATQEGNNVAGEYILLSATADPTNPYESELLLLDDTVLGQQLDHLAVTPNPYSSPLLKDPALKGIDEPTVYDDFVESVILGTNPAIEKVLAKVQASRTEANTRLLRVLRNSAASLAFKGIYRADDPWWDALAAKL